MTRPAQRPAFLLVVVAFIAFLAVALMAVVSASVRSYTTVDRLEANGMITRQMIDSTAAWLSQHPDEPITLDCAAIVGSHRKGTVIVQRKSSGEWTIRAELVRRGGRTHVETVTIK
jgi:hypothetical protein